MENNIVVSIILPYYNADKYIRETIDSIVKQTYKEWELIIIDDCSTNIRSLEIVAEEAQRDSRIKLIKATYNGGAGLARNLGIKSSVGRYIAFCDSDDWWYPTKLEEQLTFMQNNGYEFTCTYYEDATENLVPFYIVRQAEKQSYNDMIVGCNIGTPGVIYDTKRIGKKYMPALRRAEDWGLWMEILKDVDYIYTYPKPLWKYRHVSGSETSNKLKQILSVVKMYQMVLRFPKIKAWLVCLFVFLPNNIKKKIKKIVKC